LLEFVFAFGVSVRNITSIQNAIIQNFDMRTSKGQSPAHACRRAIITDSHASSWISSLGLTPQCRRGVRKGWALRITEKSTSLVQRPMTRVSLRFIRAFPLTSQTIGAGE
jgi:hypothetical protein